MKTTVRAMLLAPPPEAVTGLMARYCAAYRLAYKRLVEGDRPLDIEKIVAAKFRLNSRYAKDAVYEAASLIRAQTELVKLRVREWEKRLTAAQARGNQALSPKKPKGAADEHAKALSPLNQQGLASKVARCERKLAFWQQHQEAGTHPPVVFGGRKLFQQRCAGKISREEWRERRSHRLVSRGDATKGGNLNLRLMPGGPGGAMLEIAVPGEGRIAPRFTLPVCLPRKVSKKTGAINGTDWRSLVLAYIGTGKPYQVELIRHNGQVYCHITLEEAPAKLRETRRYLGVDTNPDGLAATLVLPDGNFKRSWWLGDGELTYARTNRRQNRVGELAARLVFLAERQGATLVVENLQFIDDRDLSAKFNRISHQFVYSSLIEAIERRATRKGVPLIKVHPAYTSIIGALKYAPHFGLSIHQAAALVIARRGMGLKEAVPKPLRHLVNNVTALPEWKAYAALKKAILKQLKPKGVKSLVSWPHDRRSVLGPASALA